MYKKIFTWHYYAQKVAAHPTGASSTAGYFQQTATKIMRISLIYMFILVLSLGTCFAVKVNAQEALKTKVGASFTNSSLENAIQQLGKLAKVKFVYSDGVIDVKAKVNASFTNITLASALDKVLEGKEIGYEVVNDEFIVLKLKESKTKVEVKREDRVEAKTSAWMLVSGVVRDEAGVPIPGVSVKVKDSTAVTATNLNGFFALNVNGKVPVLIFSYIGYKTKQLSGEKEMNVTLQPDPSKLDEVVVIGYGTTTRRLSTGSQVGISAKDIEKQPVTNALQALQGRLAGVTITQTNGLPGAGINVQIRGANSIGRASRPFYIIDGVPFLAEPINTASSLTSVLPSAEGQTSPLNTINPSDIESIEVLKDADATSIYGSRGANGVVLITTKKGVAGKTKFNVTATSGAAVVAHFVDLLETDQYLALRRKGFANLTTNPTTPNATNAPDLLLWDQNASTNWQKELLGGTARTHDINGSLSGGDTRTNFYISGTYHKEGNVYPGEQGYQRGGFKANINHASVDQRFTVGFSAMYSTDKNTISTTELANFAYSLPPNFPIYKPDGTLYWASGTNNPYGFLDQTNENKSSNLLSSLNLKYTLLKGLDIKTTLGYSKTDMNQVTLRPLRSLNTAFSVPLSGSAAYAYTYSNNYILEPQITYNKKVWKGVMNLLAGGTYQLKESRQPYYTSATGFSSDDFLRTVSLATTVSTSSSSRDYKYASLFGRLNYNIADRYIVNANFRRDGSSRFGPNNKFGNFGSVGAAWIFSEEKFLKNNAWLSFGKLRGSYGVVGSDEIGDYQYLASFTSNTAVYNGVSSLAPSRIANDDFRWESTKKLEVGLELGFLKDRLSLTTSYYRNRAGNQLINYPLSAQTGFTSYQGNLPATVQNSGIELTIMTTNIKSKDFSWTSSFNISRNNNKLLSFANIEKTSYYTQYQVGKPINSFYAYQFLGIDPVTNLPSFADLNNVGGTGNPTGGFAQTGRGDRYYVGPTAAKFFGGLSNTISYKGLSLDVTFQFVKQKGRSLANATFYPPGYMYNGAASVFNDYLALGSQDYLVTAGTANSRALAAYLGYSNWTGSDANIVDASFIRLKNVNLSYQIPSNWLTKLHAQNIRVFTQAQNLFTITGYDGFDPESQGIVTPPLRAIVAGLQFTF